MQNSVATCSAHPDLLLTASADETVRLTNMRTGARIAACFGDVAHLAEVLCVAWHPTKTWLAASAGLDDAVAVWDLQPVRNEHFLFAYLHQGCQWLPSSGVGVRSCGCPHCS